jgi:hypothetical protein
MLIEVSTGEAIDKLTILDIKLEKISDSCKSKFIQEERDYLFNLLSTFIKKYMFFFQTLKKVNLEIWELQDRLRLLDGNNSSYSKLCEKVILLNDSRFLIKNKINKIENSQFQEQKGYNKRIINLFFNKFSYDIHYPLVRFFSILYDEVKLNTYIELFKDDITIKKSETFAIFENKDEDYIISEGQENIKYKIIHPFLKFCSFRKNFDISSEINNFYEKIDLDPSISSKFK